MFHSTDTASATVARIDAFLARHAPPTPCVVIDLETVRQRCTGLRDLLAQALMYYAVKANPAAEVIAALAGSGIGFEVTIGDPVDFLSAGAYTASYAPVEFNGFTPLATHCV